MRLLISAGLFAGLALLAGCTPADTAPVAVAADPDPQPATAVLDAAEALGIVDRKFNCVDRSDFPEKLHDGIPRKKKRRAQSDGRVRPLAGLYKALSP